MFKGKNVRVYLVNIVEALQNDLPDEVDTVDTIRKYLPNVINKYHTQIPQLERKLNDLFQFEKIKKKSTFARGFPGIVLTSLVGKYVSEEYNPATNFYDINPRPLFEKHIGPILRDKYNAPMGQSDPLNVAKNINELNKSWANNKRPQSSAEAAVELVEWAVSASPGNRENLLKITIWCYLSLANLFSLETPDIESGIKITEIYDITTKLIELAPAGGSTAQLIVGLLIQAQHFLFDAKNMLEGVGESVYTTNTTSGKPGDFSENFDNSFHIYEVTTKKVDIQRLNESATSITSYLNNLQTLPESLEITFLCNLSDVDLPINVTEQGITYVHANYTYNIVQLNNWILQMFERLGIRGRSKFTEGLNTYIKSSDCPLSVKRNWVILTQI